MKQKLKAKVKEIAQHPQTKQALTSMKPEKNFWGISGVILFFIAPEIIAYIWGTDITQYAQNQLQNPQDFLGTKYYELLVMLFEEGMSYLNLAIGIVLLIWLFF